MPDASLRGVLEHPAREPVDEWILCATSRLARTLPLEAAMRAATGEAGVMVPRTATIEQWLSGVLEESLLSGELDPAILPERILSPLAERLLWQKCIEADLDAGVSGALLDPEGLADAAMQAANWMDLWELRVPSGGASEETRRFLNWRDRFRGICERRGWTTPSMWLAQQVGRIDTGIGRLPDAVVLAGFVRRNAVEDRLMRALERRGTRVREDLPDASLPAGATCIGLSDAAAECRAAVRWAVGQLEADAGARVGIVVPDLAARRTLIARLLDAELDVGSVYAGKARRNPRYNVSLGVPLAHVPLVATALSLLRIVVQREFSQSDLSPLLTGSGWSSDVTEADARARLDARIRFRLPARTDLASLRSRVEGMRKHGVPIDGLLEGLERVIRHRADWPGSQLPSAWQDVFRDVLEALGWPGERGLDSHDHQAKEAFHEALEALAQLDDITGAIPAISATVHLGRICRERLFQPKTEGLPRLQVLGVLEATGERFDALWVMGMNDDLWPPAPSPSPLLPADLQRRAEVPGASTSVQAEFARAVQHRWQHSAPLRVFSWARQAGDSQLRPSPLLAGLSEDDPPAALASTLGEVLQREAVPDRIEHLTCDPAPIVPEGAMVSGGTDLFRTQAICPAWAFYRHRLQARPLETPVDGIDARQRGSLVHRALEFFWHDTSSTDLKRIDPEALEQRIGAAVESAIEHQRRRREILLTDTFEALESRRLIDLLQEWVAFELTRKQPFRVHVCEQKSKVEVGGIEIDMIVDRIDAIGDTGMLILDYKTGSSVDAGRWTEDRLVEPQLPLYASYVETEAPIVGIALAKIRFGDMKFVGITGRDDLLPGVKVLGDGSKASGKSASRGPDGAEDPDRHSPADPSGDAEDPWMARIDAWRAGFSALAQEFRSGEAGVWFTREKDLAFCDVLPILRLPERRQLYRQRRPEMTGDPE